MALSFPYTLTDGTNFSWTFNYYGSVVSGTRSEFYSGASVSPSVYASTVTFDPGNREIVYGPSTSYSSVEHSRKVYVSDREGFVRYIEIFTNTGSSTVTQDVDLSSSLTSYSADAVKTSDGDATFSASDNWIVRDDTTDAKAAVTHVISGAYGMDPTSVSSSGSSLSYAFDLELKPGETKIVMHFLALDSSVANGVKQATSLVDLKGDALTGLSEFELDHIVNFVPGEVIQLDYKGTSRADFLIGDRYDESFKAGAGNDIIYADDGKDVVDAGGGNDLVLAEDGNDVVSGGFGADTINGGNGDDSLIGDTGSGLETSTRTTTIRSTGEKLSVSMTLPDQDNGTSVPVTGFVSRTPITSSQFNVAFVVDISGSTSSTFSGKTTVADKNGDGVANTVLDAEIAGFEALLQGITKQVGAENVNVAVIPFASDAYTAMTGNAARDSDGDGISDVVESLRSLDDTGSTDFEAGLQQAVNYFNGTTEGQNLVFFLSDGGNNDGGATTEEVTSLLSKSGTSATIRSFGVGSGAIKSDLDLVDDLKSNDSVDIVLDPSDLSNVLIDPGIDKTDVRAVQFYVNGALKKSISGSQLTETPLGLSFSFDTVLSGLSATKSDVVTVRVIARDADRTTVSTSQIIEVAKESGGNDVLFGGNGDDIVYGNSGHDRLHGGNGTDLLYGESGNDKVYGDRGSDILDGGAGNDLLDGGLGVDRMIGGAGNDSFYVDRAADRVIEARGEGNDRIYAAVNYTLSANVETLVLTGSATSGTGRSASESLYGNARANLLKGNGGNDMLSGGAGNDRLFGDAGKDRLQGDAGADRLYGGTGADIFVYRSIKDSTTASSGRDVISDFSHSQGDRIDLSAIDANTRASGNQAFSFIGDHDFTRKAGQLHYDRAGGDTYVEGDVNGDGRADFSIRIDASLALKAGDFLL